MFTRVDCHNHTRYSNLRLRDAIASPEQLIDKAIEIGLSGIAITDHEALSSHPSANIYAQKIKEEHPDFKVILGNEIYLVDSRPSEVDYHYILLAKDAVGHYQLRRLSTLAWLNCYTRSGLTRVVSLKDDLKEIIMKNPGHLISSTACIGGELGKTLLKLRDAEKTNNLRKVEEYNLKIEDFISWNKEIFGKDFYLEVQPGISAEQIYVNKKIRIISEKYGIKVIPTSDTHYLTPSYREIHKAFLNSEDKEREVDAFYMDAYLHTDEDMYTKFLNSEFEKEYIEQLFLNTKEIYDKVQDFSLLHSQQIPEVDVDYYPIDTNDNLPEYPILNNMYKSEDNIERYWIHKCIDKLKEIGKFKAEYLEELEEEADVKYVISRKLDTNMFSYPVALSHYIDMIWECGSTVGVGRGSACSALNHYLLGITQLDSLEWNFPFFRYMNRDTDGLGSL